MEINSSFKDYYDHQSRHSSDFVTYVRNTYFKFIDTVPMEFNKIHQELRYDHKKDNTKKFELNSLIVGIYPDIIIFPIEIYKDKDDGFTKCKISDLSEYNYIRSLKDMKWKDAKKSLKEHKLYDRYERNFIFYDTKFMHHEDDVNHVYFPSIIESSGIKFNDEYNNFALIDQKKVFKELKAPIFVTDLNFRYCICNPRLDSISINLMYNEFKDEKWNFINLELPKEFKLTTSKSICDRICDFVTSSNEDQMINVSDESKLTAYGFNNSSFRITSKEEREYIKKLRKESKKLRKK